MHCLALLLICMVTAVPAASGRKALGLLDQSTTTATAIAEAYANSGSSNSIATATASSSTGSDVEAALNDVQDAITRALAQAASGADAPSTTQTADATPNDNRSSGSSGGSGQFATKQAGDDPLALHNAYRSPHGSPALTWDASLARGAQDWADQLACKSSLSHSGSDAGENLASGYQNWADAVWAWYKEYDQYDFSRPGWQPAAGHFTQVVWASTARLGCASTSSGSCQTVYVCRYDPAGNIDSSDAFAENVKAP